MVCEYSVVSKQSGLEKDQSQLMEIKIKIKIKIEVEKGKEGETL